MRVYLYLITFLLPLKAWATCPELAFITESIKEIHARLIQNSDAPLVIKGMKFIVRHGEGGKSVDDLLGGNFQGYRIDRFKETTPGKCRYRVRDDRTPVTGDFILYQQ